MKYIIALLLMVIPAMGATDSILVVHPTTATAAATLSSPSLTQLGNAGQFALLPNNNTFAGSNTFSGVTQILNSLFANSVYAQVGAGASGTALVQANSSDNQAKFYAFSSSLSGALYSAQQRGGPEWIFAADNVLGTYTNSAAIGAVGDPYIVFDYTQTRSEFLHPIKGTSATFSGVVTAATLSGNGAAIAALNASSLSSGTVPDARLSGNVVTTTGGFTIGGNNTFSGTLNVTGTNSAGILTITQSTATYPAFVAYGDSTSSSAGSTQFGLFGKTDPNMQFLFGYDTSVDKGVIASVHQGVGATPIQIRALGLEVLNPFGACTLTMSGNIVISTAGSGIQIKTGSNAKFGTVALVAGVASVTTTAKTATNSVQIGVVAIGGTAAQQPFVSAVSGTTFTISGTVTDTSTVSWLIIDPAP